MINLLSHPAVESPAASACLLDPLAKRGRKDCLDEDVSGHDVDFMCFQ